MPNNVIVTERTKRMCRADEKGSKRSACGVVVGHTHGEENNKKTKKSENIAIQQC